MKLELTQTQIFELASRMFDEINEGEGFGKFEDQNRFVQNDWIRAAHRAIEGYNKVEKYVTFPNVSIVKDCCMICKHVNLYRPACNLRGDDISLECVCSKFELSEFYEEGDDI